MNHPSVKTDLNSEPAVDEVARYAAGLKAATQEIYALHEQKTALAADLAASRNLFQRLDHQHRQDLLTVFKHLQTNFSDLDQVSHPQLANLFRALAIQHHRTSIELFACRNEVKKSKRVLEELMGVARSHAELEKAHLAQSSVLQRVQSELAQAQAAGKDQSARMQDLELELKRKVSTGDSTTFGKGQRRRLPKLEAADEESLHDYQDNRAPRQLEALERNRESYSVQGSNILGMHPNGRSYDDEASRPHLDHRGHMRQNDFRDGGMRQGQHDDHDDRREKQLASSRRRHSKEYGRTHGQTPYEEFAEPHNQEYGHHNHDREQGRRDASNGLWDKHERDIYHRGHLTQSQEQNGSSPLPRQQHENYYSGLTHEIRGQDDRRRISDTDNNCDSSSYPPARNWNALEANQSGNNYPNQQNDDGLRPRSDRGSRVEKSTAAMLVMPGGPDELRLPPLSAPNERTSLPHPGR